MKQNLLTSICVILLTIGSYGQVAINETGASPDPSAILDISSTNKGLLIPRVTTTERNAIGTTQTGLLVYDTDTESFWYYDNTQTSWVEIIVEGNLDIDGLSDAKTDTRSVFLGNFSGDNDDGSNYNTAVGIFSLRYNTSGQNNVSMGYGASENTTSGSNNTSVGFYSSRVNTEGEKNTVIGTYANYLNQTGSNNTIIGFQAGRGISAHSKSGNVFLGYMAGYNETGDNKLYIENSDSPSPLIGGDFSTNEIYFNGTIKITGGSPGVNKILTSDAAGVASWQDNGAAFNINGLSDGKTDASSVFLGDSTGYNDDGDNFNTAIGFNAMPSSVSGQKNISVGYKSMFRNISGSYNTAIGYLSMVENSSGVKNIAIGSFSLYWNTTGVNNIAVGYNSLIHNATGVSNVAIGTEALCFNTTKSNLVAIGDSVLYYNGNNVTSDDQAVYNTAVGSKSLLYNTTGHNNSALGYKSMYSNEDGSHNISFGHESLRENISGSYNVSLGSFSSSFNTTGGHNVNIGYGSDYYNTGGSNNTIIGYKAGFGSSGVNRSGNIFIGREAGFNETGSNKLYIENSNSATPLIGGDFDTDEVYLHGDVGIGTSSLFEKLHIAEDNGTTDGSDGCFALIQNTNGSTNVLSGIRFMNGTTANTSKGGIFYRDMLGYGRGDIVFVNNSAGSSGNATFADARMTIKNNGKIGMGTSNPNELLEVANPTNDYGRMIVSDGGGSSRNALLFVSPVAANQYARIEAYNYGTSTGLSLSFNTVGGGKIGIGTSSPLGQLHVHDKNNSNSTIYITPKSTSNGDSASVFFAEDKNATNGMYWMYDGQTNNMGLWGKSGATIYGPHLLIDRNTGDIAVGGENFATGYKLSVEGKVICEEVKVSLQADWPDYVFSDNYNLMPIDEFGSFIHKNGHLPNIPAAVDVENSGLEIGEMQRLLLEKVEELSLYILKQDERISELEKKLSNTQK